MKIDVRIITPDLVEVSVWPSFFQWLLGHRFVWARAAGIGPVWLWVDRPGGPDDATVDAIDLAFADLDARRRAETARNYQAAAQRGEYPIR